MPRKDAELLTGRSFSMSKIILIMLVSLLAACGGGGGGSDSGSDSPQAPVDNSPNDPQQPLEPEQPEQPQEPEQPEQPEVITVPYDDARAGAIDGVNIWQMPDAPDGSRPDQSWLAVGSDTNGEIYISGHDHQTNAMLYRMYQHDNTLRWVGDAKAASEAANNWQSNESAEKFHTRPIDHNGTVYVATLDSSDMNYSFWLI